MSGYIAANYTSEYQQTKPAACRRRTIEHIQLICCWKFDADSRKATQ